MQKTAGIPTRSGIVVLGALFTVSGASGLVVEQVFEKLLTTVVGSAVQSGAIVLSVFFGGLCAGGALYTKLSRRVTNPFYLYGALELIVAASALVLALLLSPIQTLSSRLIHLAGHDDFRIFVARLFVACAWMALPTLAMGATYPCVVRIVARLAPSRIARTMTRFYTLNLLGAVTSAALGPYVLFPRFGLDGVLRATGFVQLVVSLLAVYVGRRYASSVDETANEATAKPDEVSPRSSTNERAPGAPVLRDRRVAFLMVGALLSGFVVFALEVLWFHLIGVVLGMSAYAFGLMLAVVLFGLLLGSTVIGALPGKPRVGDVALPVSLFASAAVLTLSASLWDDVPRWLFGCHVGFSDFPCGPPAVDFWSAENARLRIALALVGIPSLFLGMVYPALFRTSIYPKETADTTAGILGATNAVGSILGALVTSFVLIPRFGSEQAYRWLSIAPAAVGLLAIVALPFSRPTKIGLGALGAFAALVAVRGASPWDRLELTSGLHVYLVPQHVSDDAKLLYWHEDSTGGIVTVVARERGPHTTKTLLTNGKFQGNDGGESHAQTGLALLPAMATSRRDRALVVGLGTGHSAAVLHAAGFRELEIAEISRGIVDASREHFASLHHGILERPGVHLFLEDARNHLLRTERPYDVISMELSSVWFAGVNNLYSREYYELAHRNLRKGGILQQWIQLHHLAKSEVVSVLSTVGAVFPHVQLYYLGSQGIILASDDPIVLARADAAHVPDALRAQLGPLEGMPFWPGIDHLEDTLLLSEDDVALLSAWGRSEGVPLTTDANRYLEYTTPRHALERSWTADHTARDLIASLPPERRAQRERALSLNR